MRFRLIALLALLLVLPRGPLGAQDAFDGVKRIVAIGDVHGDFDQCVAVLRAAGVVDRRNRWTGGSLHLVQTGDVLDRGPHSRKVLDLLMSLEKQARAAGGRVHALIGNHEAMNLIGDLRYVSEGEYAAFRSRDSGELRARAFEVLADPASREDPAYRARWEAEHPLGWVEHRRAFGPMGTYGKWLRQRNAIVRINGIVFLHGGLSPKFGTLTISEINQRVRQELAGTNLPEGGLSVDEDGPLWYRGLATLPETELREHVERLLSLHKARHIVIGHTIVAPAIVPRLNGRVVAIDVGLSERYKGPPAALIVEGERLFALHRGHRLALPQDGAVRAYLEEVAKLDPQPSPILEVIEKVAPAKDQQPPRQAHQGADATTGARPTAVGTRPGASHAARSNAPRSRVPASSSHARGQIAHVAHPSRAAELPAPDEPVEGVEYLRHRCAECEGERSDLLAPDQPRQVVALLLQPVEKLTQLRLVHRGSP